MFLADALASLLELSEDEKESLGAVYTPWEIAHQVDLWDDTCRRVEERGTEFTLLPSSLRVILTGAGSSDFVGKSLEMLWRDRLGLDVQACATTDILTHPRDFFRGDVPYLIVSFARSGNSPESVGVFDLAHQLSQDVRQIVVTCNGEGSLARRAMGAEQRALVIILDEATNDRGLAMTSSFTNMVVAGQSIAFLDKPSLYRNQLAEMNLCGRNLLENYPDIVKEIAERDFDRAIFLGGGALRAAAHESALKLLELTDGTIMTRYDSFLGVRHGPASAINGRTLVVYLVSSDPYVRQYELDLMREIKERKAAALTVALCHTRTCDIEGLCDILIDLHPSHPSPQQGTSPSPMPDALRPPIDVIFGQLLGLFKSLSLGYKPDVPSARGIINRVVQGVRVYPFA